MNRKIIIIVCLVMAAILTFLVWRSANVKYAELRRTVDVVKVTQFIPAGSEIRPGQAETVKIPETIGKEFVADINQVIGKTAKVSMIEGQYVFPGSVGDIPRKPDTVEVHMAVDLSSSAVVFAGDTVDVYAIDKDQKAAKAVEVFRGARVLHSFDSSGMELSPAEKKTLGQVAGPPGARVPASVGLEVSREAAAAIAQVASQKRIYLVKSDLAR